MKKGIYNSFDKTVIVINVEGLSDVIDDGKVGYVVEAESPIALADAVADYFLQGKEKEFIQNVNQEAYCFSWDRMAETIEGFAEQIE